MFYNGSQNNQQMYYHQPNTQQTMPQRQQVSSQKGTIDVVVTVDDTNVSINYPVAPNTTVMFVNFNTGEFVLKTVDNFGRQYPLETYNFTKKEESQTNFQNDLSYRDEVDKKINDLSKSVKDMYKMLEDLTAPSEKQL